MRSVHDMQQKDVASSDPQLDHLSTVDDFGLDSKLADFLEMPSGNLDPLVHIIKAFDPDPHKPSTQLKDALCDWNVFFCQDMMALRRTVRSMLKPVFNSRVS